MGDVLRWQVWVLPSSAGLQGRSLYRSAQRSQFTPAVLCSQSHWGFTCKETERKRLMKRCLIKGKLNSLRLWSIQDWRHVYHKAIPAITHQQWKPTVCQNAQRWKLEGKERADFKVGFLSQITFLWVGGVSKSKTPLFESASTNQHTGSFQRLLWHFVADFVATKADILKDTSGDYPAEFVVTKSDVLDETSAAFPAVFVATKPGIVR